MMPPWAVHQRSDLQKKPVGNSGGLFDVNDSEKKIVKNEKKMAVLIFFPLPDTRLVCSVKKSLKPAVWLVFWTQSGFAHKTPLKTVG
jgi:hypothetical protein